MTKSKWKNATAIKSHAHMHKKKTKNVECSWWFLPIHFMLMSHWVSQSKEKHWLLLGKKVFKSGKLLHPRMTYHHFTFVLMRCWPIHIRMRWSGSVASRKCCMYNLIIRYDDCFRWFQSKQKEIRQIFADTLTSFARTSYINRTGKKFLQKLFE